MKKGCPVDYQVICLKYKDIQVFVYLFSLGNLHLDSGNQHLEMFAWGQPLLKVFVVPWIPIVNINFFATVASKMTSIAICTYMYFQLIFIWLPVTSIVMRSHLHFLGKLLTKHIKFCAFSYSNFSSGKFLLLVCAWL